MIKCSCGKEDCNGLCSTAITNRMVDFLERIVTINSDIGSTRSEQSICGGTTKFYTVTGVQYGEGLTRTDILSSCENASMKAYKWFNRVNGENLKELIGNDREDSKELIKRLSGLNNNTVIAVPIMLGEDCMFNVNMDGKSRVEALKVESLVIKRDAEDELCYTVISEKVSASVDKKRCIVDMKSYGREFRTAAVGVNKLAKKSEDFEIEILPNGCIRPIEFQHGEASIIVDGTDIYYKNDTTNEEYVAGRWLYNEIVFDTDILDDVLTKRVKKCRNLVEKHKRYIVPYKVLDTTKIIVR